MADNLSDMAPSTKPFLKELLADFLSAAGRDRTYDKKMRAKRGVFYTPSRVVRFIVRSVDEILKTEFGIEDGLASTTWGEYLARSPVLLPLPLGEGRGEGSPHSSPRPP